MTASQVKGNFITVKFCLSYKLSTTLVYQAAKATKQSSQLPLMQLPVDINILGRRNWLLYLCVHIGDSSKTLCLWSSKFLVKLQTNSALLYSWCLLVSRIRYSPSLDSRILIAPFEKGICKISCSWTNSWKQKFLLWKIELVSSLGQLFFVVQVLLDNNVLQLRIMSLKCLDFFHKFLQNLHFLNNWKFVWKAHTSFVRLSNSAEFCVEGCFFILKASILVYKLKFCFYTSSLAMCMFRK